MTSSKVRIGDVGLAIREGTIPGQFNPDFTVFHFPQVVSAGAHGKRLYWTIRVYLLDPQGVLTNFTAEMLEQPSPQLPGHRGVIETDSWIEGGKKRAGGRPTYIAEGKNLGKKNATNVLTQAILEARSLYNLQLKKTARRAPAYDSSTGVAIPPTGPPRPPPMLVKRYGSSPGATLKPIDWTRGVFVQRKYNGLRTVIYSVRPQTAGVTSDEVGNSSTSDPSNSAGHPASVVMYSRTGGEFSGLDHIRAELAPALADPPPVPPTLRGPASGCPAVGAADPARYGGPEGKPTVYLDGEIYLHGRPLQWISGQTRREDDSGDLEIHIYDVFFPDDKRAGEDMPAIHRQAYLDLFIERARSLGEIAHVHRVENTPVRDVAQIKALMEEYVAEGYEGVIIRRGCEGYRYSYNNYHSSNVLKMKPLYDAEFATVGYTQGTRGKDVGAVVWICEVDEEDVVIPTDKTFNVVPKDMTYEERYQVYKCLGEQVPNFPGAIARGEPARLTRFERDFFRRPLTVEYPERSNKTGKPVQAKAVTFRTYEGNLADDPLKRLFDECAERVD